MDKLLLMLTLVAFSSGVLCNEAQNLTDDLTQDLNNSIIETQLNNAVCKLKSVCTNGAVRDDYTSIRNMGAYKLHKNSLATWNEAREICMNEGAQLAFITSNVEGWMLVDWMIKEKVTYPAWVGIHDLFKQGHWVTLTGETLQAAGYDHWLPGEPNNAGGNEHCGSLETSNGMNDLTCDRKLPYFCKMEVTTW